MNSKLTTLEAKLKTWRLTRPSNEDIVDQIYKVVFEGDFYREIWDEPILLGLQQFIEAHPPDPEFHGAKLQEINQRTSEVVAIDDLFYSVMSTASASSAKLFEQLKQHLEADKDLRAIEMALSGIRGSNSDLRTKIEQLVREMSMLVPGISGLLVSCFEAVQDRQAIGMANGLLVTESGGIGVVLPVRSKVQAGTGKVELGIGTEESFSSAVKRARGALQSMGLLSTSQDIFFTVDHTDATYVGSSISLPSAMAIYSSAREWRFDPFTAFTGDVNIRGPPLANSKGRGHS
ncbi:MAG: hypothetical protein M3R52_00980 [Acidobacteriota bacterium]|nr:hypothetical protein [Acidobacteriota bacterium]